MNSIHPQDTNAQRLVYDFVKEKILSLQARPGERLVGGTIANSLGVSRTPVREALGRLEQEGLLARDSGWGYTVRPITFEGVMDLYRVRLALEVEAAREAIAHLDDSRIAVLERTLKTAEAHLDEGDMVAFMTACRFLHGTIAATTRNALLQQMIDMINDRVRIVSAVILDKHPPRGREIHEENIRLIAALRERDGDLAERRVREHIANATRYAGELLGRDRNAYAGN